MNTASFVTQTASQTPGALIQRHVDKAIEDLLGALPNPGRLSAERRRGIIARYTAVLEGNFIYWMTGAYLAVKSEKAREIILDNLSEEVRDSHPRMLREFALAARAIPTDADAIAIHGDLTNVRLFVGGLAAVPIIVMMAFFEGFIQKFMAYLLELSAKQGSAEREYADVHGVCDVAHTRELYEALEAEMALDPPDSATNLFEGVNLLRTLILCIIDPVTVENRTHAVAVAAPAVAS